MSNGRNRSLTSLATLAVLSVVLALGATGCRSIATATPDELDPGAIEAAIRSQFLVNYPDETFDIGVAVSNAGVVTLSGSVDSNERRTRLAEIARAVDGVARVVNELKVQ